MTALLQRTFAAVLLTLLASTATAQNKVVVLEIEGGIGVATADYLSSGLRHAREQNAELVIVDIDTPGGLVKPMRDMVQDILNSPVPVATFVTPAGARADSAGTYILLASHVAAMAPTTHIGAATPVSLNGEDVTPESIEEPAETEDSGGESEAEESPEDADEQIEREPPPRAGTAMERKMLNDAVAYIRGLAERHGRNADWAEDAVVDAATLTAEEALEINVIEFIADDHADLLEQINGHEVKLDSELVALETGSVTIENFEPNWRIKILSAIANPEIVLLLGIVGLYGLMYEGWNPGAIVPGVVGVICLLLAAYALQVLPVNYAGLALIIVGIGLMTAEAFAPSFGALGLGGIAAFVFGAIMMFDSGIPGFGISIAFVIGLAIVAAAAIIWLVGFALKLRRRGAVSGRGSIIGGVGTAMEDFTGDGKIWLEGESWAAKSKVPIQKDQQVVVTAMKGLTLEVKPASTRDTGEPQIQT
jgi:membrane-bound serine protease (ClpP class)